MWTRFAQANLDEEECPECCLIGTVPEAQQDPAQQQNGAAAGRMKKSLTCFSQCMFAINMSASPCEQQSLIADHNRTVRSVQGVRSRVQILLSYLPREPCIPGQY